MKTALILVDLQNDFLPGGALAVPEGDRAVRFANGIVDHYDIVIATQDWHPSNHGSFASQHAAAHVGDIISLDGLEQILWPDHCIENTAGAAFAPELRSGAIDKVIAKGTDRQIDSYSGFFDNARRKATELESFLREQSVGAVHIMGLATDYCVKFTALDASDLGFETTLLLDGCRGVNLKAGDCDRAIREMQDAGVFIKIENE